MPKHLKTFGKHNALNRKRKLKSDLLPVWTEYSETHGIWWLQFEFGGRNDLFKITRYSVLGDVQAVAIFITDSDFNVNEISQIHILSGSSKIAVTQNNKTILFTQQQHHNKS